MKHVRLGIDLGGTKIEIVAMGNSGDILLRKRVATPKIATEIYDAIATLVLDAEAELQQEGTVGLATPGAISPKTGLLRNSNTVCMNHQPVKQEIEKRLNREVRMSNDANCFALSEAVDGAGKGAKSVFGVILGTGVGAGLIWNGEVIDGPNAIAGEWGHNPLPWPRDEERPGPACFCGRSGCIETFLSGTGIQKRFHSETGRDWKTAEIVAQAAAGDSEAEQFLQRCDDMLARALAHIINVFDPEVIVLGGGVSNIERWYSTVPNIWGKYVFSDVVNTELKRALHGDSSGVRGAAWLHNK